MDTEKASQELSIIRELMVRPVRYSTMSGAAGVLAGVVALAAVGADALVWRSWPSGVAAMLEMAVWGVAFVVASAGVIGLTRLRERRQGLPFWTYARRRVIRSCVPPYMAAFGLTMAILLRWYLGQEDLWGMIPPIWMICYGQACWEISEFSLPELRVMGAAFIVSAAVAVFLPEWPYATLGVTFGGYHIIYGIVVWIRHGG